jgi:aerotaxis receptor
MRKNLPVTSTERFLVQGRPIVTKTDLQSVITYVNESFLDISGFTREELIGQPHNMVRHPDMPPEAFADMWRVLKSGNPWRGMVKNRCKNGDFYWVDAYVTPLTENGRPIGYMSVRLIPARAQVTEAEALYAAIRNGKATFPATPKNSSWPLARVLSYAVPAGVAALSLLAGFADGSLSAAAGLLAALTIAAYAAWCGVVQAQTLQQIAEAIRAIDEGKLDVPVQVPKGLFQTTFSLLETTRIHLRAVFADVLLSARKVEQRSVELDGAMRSFVEQSAQQSSRIMEAAAAMEEMSVAINELTESNRGSLTAVERTRECAGEGLSVVKVGISSSQQAVEAAQAAQGKIREVNETISMVAQTTGIIREIADQTNLLALNAAIEAARAGEQGRGFAVVADEVRKLAERTALSTADIHKAINAITAQSSQAVSSMDGVSESIVQSTGDIRRSCEQLSEIHTASEEATRLSGEISNMLHQQSLASHEFANNMERISSSLESNDATIQSVGNSAQDMRLTSGELMRLIQHLEAALK